MLRARRKGSSALRQLQIYGEDTMNEALAIMAGVFIPIIVVIVCAALDELYKWIQRRRKNGKKFYKRMYVR